MTGKSVKVKLGKPRLALLWFIPAESISADLEAQFTTQLSESEDNVSEPQTPEDAATAEEIEKATGFDIKRIASLLTSAAEQYERDPESVRSAIRAIVGDDEIAARWLLDLILGMKAENGDDDYPGEDAEIIDFERPDDDGEDEP